MAVASERRVRRDAGFGLRLTEAMDRRRVRPGELSGDEPELPAAADVAWLDDYGFYLDCRAVSTTGRTPPKTLDDLAIFGAPPAFDRLLHVGRPEHRRQRPPARTHRRRGRAPAAHQ